MCCVFKVSLDIRLTDNVERAFLKLDVIYTMSLMEGVKHLQIPLEEIKMATNNFSDENFIARGGFGNVYIGQLTLSGQQSTVAVKRLDRTLGQGNREFLMEIQMLSSYKHKNLISLVGFCDENEENILVYEYAKHGSLDKYLDDNELSWMQRLQISIGAAHGLNYLHNHAGPQHRVMHRDIKSSNILLNENWEAKISDFGLSKIGPSNVRFTFLVTSACGTFGYVDPQYIRTGILTKESDVYSFGVVLFEILCGRLALVDQYEDERRFLATLAQRYCEENRLDEIIHPNLMSQMKVDSLNMFTTVAYQCLKENRCERPTMSWILEKLEKALALQAGRETTRQGYIRIATLGTQSGGPQHNWSFELKNDHNLKTITIDHKDVIYSLMFTSEHKGVLHTSNKAGGWDTGDKVSKVMFDAGEEIIGVNGTIDTEDGHMIISSLSFETNRGIRRTFGRATKTKFSLPWSKGSLGGFYGAAGQCIHGISVYLKAHEEILRIGPWGRSECIGPHNIWSFQLERNHRLKKISIGHRDALYSLMFTTECRHLTSVSKQAGGWNAGYVITEVTFDEDEEINGINGTFVLSRYVGYGKISSITFLSNKRTHGPFGEVKGTPFTVAWDDGSFAGFYGLASHYIDSIGVYLKATS